MYRFFKVLRGGYYDYVKRMDIKEQCGKLTDTVECIFGLKETVFIAQNSRPMKSLASS